MDIAPDGRTALERLRIIPYDLLITDLKMPGVDGLTVIREARRLKPDIPVIIVTGFSTEASAIEAVNLGVSGYLTNRSACRACSPPRQKRSANSERLAGSDSSRPFTAFRPFTPKTTPRRFCHLERTRSITQH